LRRALRSSVRAMLVSFLAMDVTLDCAAHLKASCAAADAACCSAQRFSIRLVSCHMDACADTALSSVLDKGCYCIHLLKTTVPADRWTALLATLQLAHKAHIKAMDLARSKECGQMGSFSRARSTRH
jgi:hypothetical protein